MYSPLVVLVPFCVRLVDGELLLVWRLGSVFKQVYHRR